MAILTMDFAGQVDVNPRLGRLVALDKTYAQITAPGYLNPIVSTSGIALFPTDFIFASYADGFGEFNPSFDGSEITLVPTTAHAFKSYSPTAESGSLAVVSADNAGDYANKITNASTEQATTWVFPDPGASSAEVLLNTGESNILTDCQQFIGINEILIASVATWTRTRVAQGNYVLRKTAADNTSVIGIDLTPAIRTAASKGFRLSSLDVIYSIGTDALEAHTLTLDKINYANNVAVAVTSVDITGTLATATQANPYVTNVTVDTPAFDNTTDSKYVLELTVNAAATTAYDFYGLMLKFSKTIA